MKHFQSLLYFIGHSQRTSLTCDARDVVMVKASWMYVGCCSLGLLFLFSNSSAFGQSNVSSAATTPSTASPLLLQFQQAQQTLGQQLSQFMGQGTTTPAQLKQWVNQNQALIQAQQSRAIQLGVASAAQPYPYVTSVEIPENASPDLEDFLTTQASLVNNRALIHNQLLQQGTISSATENTLFQQQNGAALQAQAQRAQVIAAEADQQALPMPPPLTLPPNTAPAMQAFLTLRDQLMREEIQVHNQNLQADASTRQAALLAWIQSNQSRLQHLQALAQNLNPQSD